MSPVINPDIEWVLGKIVVVVVGIEVVELVGTVVGTVVIGRVEVVVSLIVVVLVEIVVDVEVGTTLQPEEYFKVRLSK
jgi:hypothetical protein